MTDKEKEQMQKKKIYAVALVVLIGLPLLALAQGYSGLIAVQPNYKGNSGATSTGGYAGLIATPPGTRQKLTDGPAAKDLHGFIQNSGKQSTNDMRQNAMRNIAARKQERIDAQNAAAAERHQKEIDDIHARQEAERERRDQEAAARAAQQQP